MPFRCQHHGREGFERFSHARSVFTQTKVGFLGKIMRPPFSDMYRRLVAGMIKP